MFTALGAVTTKPSEESGLVLISDTTAAGQWFPWQVSSLASDSLTLITQNNASRSRVTSRTEGLHWGNYRHWSGTRGSLLGLLVLLVGVLWVVLHYLLRRLFGVLDVAPAPRAAVEPLAAPVCRFWLLPAGSAREDVPTWTLRELGQPTIVLNCRQLFDPAANDYSAKILASLPDPSLAAGHLVVLSHFNYRLTDSELTKRKCELLAELQRRGWPLLVLSTAHPEAFGACGHPLEKACAEPDHQPIRAASKLLLDTLAEFRAQYFGLANPEPLALPPNAEQQGPPGPLSGFTKRRMNIARVPPALTSWQVGFLSVW